MNSRTAYLEDAIPVLVGGTVGLYNVVGWLLPYFGILPLSHALWLCLAGGILAALYID